MTGLGHTDLFSWIRPKDMSRKLRKLADRVKRELKYLPKQSSIVSIPEIDTDSENDRDSSDTSYRRYSISRKKGPAEKLFHRPICLSPTLSENDLDNLVGYPMHYLLFVSIQEFLFIVTAVNAYM